MIKVGYSGKVNKPRKDAGSEGEKGWLRKLGPASRA
jgi:hypothetical protein